MKIAILIPCHQEEKTIGKVVSDFKRAAPEADIYVYDNNSTDRSAEIAREAGAIVRREKRQGKGFVVAAMFEQVNADVMVMVDGDDTYDASSLDRLLAPILNGEADMTVASREVADAKSSFRNFHQLGNRMVCRAINWIFGSNITDVFSGYRAFTRQAVASIPITTRGFDVETEMTLQALYRDLVIREIPAPYGARPKGSFSKLRTLPDGFAVMLRMVLIFKSYKPLTFFGSLSIGLLLLGLLAGIPPIYQYATARYVYSVPLAVLAASLMVLSFLSLGIGLTLNSVNLRLLELEKILHRTPDKIQRTPQSNCEKS
jgi:glycosyltransferase involved in cell wall biosynthesis